MVSTVAGGSTEPRKTEEKHLTATRILLADDHALIRAGIRSLLESEEEFEVVAEACDGRQALAMIKSHSPDVAVIDVTMPELNGLEVTTQIKQAFPSVGVLILSAHNDVDFVAQALKFGASGYLLKDAATEELVLAVRVVRRGQVYLTPGVARHIVDKYLQNLAPSCELAASLTPRQREILKLIAHGNRTKEIAYQLGVSIKTVEAHRALLMDRLKIRDLAGLIRYALRAGLASLDGSRSDR